jgi:hypothetical protein
MTTIMKTTFTFTVLHRTDSPLLDLAYALEESDTGHAVGNVTQVSWEQVPDDEVPGELDALGNDGEFFDDDLANECDRHGGPWGEDETCARCTYEDGTVRPLDDKGPLGPGAV